MKLKNVLPIFLLSTFCANSFAYDVVERFKLIDDKLKTDAMLRPISSRDFFFDINATLNKNVTDVVSDIEDATNFQGTTNQKITNAQNIISKYDKTEQTIKINVNFGIPIFQFTAWGVNVKPQLKVLVDAGANIGIRSEAITTELLLSLINIELPTELKNVIVATSYSAGDDLLKPAVCSAITDPVAQALCTANQGKYFYPTNANIPNLLLFAKLDGRFGLFNEYVYGEHFFGQMNIYGLSRTDIYQRINSDMIARGSKIELPSKKNTEMTAQLDYQLGYKNDNYTAMLGLEELKLATISEREAGSKEISYGYDPLMRLHADATYKLSVLSLQPFVGVHKRSGYGFGDGFYAGATAGAHVWEDRIGISMRGMVDGQYLTINPRIKMWLMQLDYSLKSPLKSTDGDVKLSALHTIDFRLFF